MEIAQVSAICLILLIESRNLSQNGSSTRTSIQFTPIMGGKQSNLNHHILHKNKNGLAWMMENCQLPNRIRDELLCKGHQSEYRLLSNIRWYPQSKISEDLAAPRLPFRCRFIAFLQELKSWWRQEKFFLRRSSVLASSSGRQRRYRSNLRCDVVRVSHAQIHSILHPFSGLSAPKTRQTRIWD